MACCCTYILELCKVPVCGNNALVKTETPAPATGNYQLKLDYLGVEVILNATIEDGQPMNFPATDLNENYKYVGKIYGPTGTLVTITIEEVEYDCISFQTVLEYYLNEPEPEEEPEEGE